MAQTSGSGRPLSRMVKQPDLSGAVLDCRFRLDSLLGEGGMGQVYQGTHLSLERTVAIKVLPPHLAEDGRFRARFAREARAAAQIVHRNVVQILDFGESPDGPLYFVMEFLDGPDLGRLLREQGRMPWERVGHILLQATSAVQAAHSKGIIHRDIKPSNCILIDSPQEQLTDVVKLLDFGIAKVSSDVTPVTQTGEILGTFSYMAPEQARGEQADVRSDIYSLGIMAYEMLSGRVPFSGANVAHLVARHLYETPEPLHRRVPDISRETDEIVQRALAKDPRDRFASMHDFGLAIQSVSSRLADATTTRSFSPSGAVAAVAAAIPTTDAAAQRASIPVQHSTVVLHEQAEAHPNDDASTTPRGGERSPDVSALHREALPPVESEAPTPAVSPPHMDAAVGLPEANPVAHNELEATRVRTEIAANAPATVEVVGIEDHVEKPRSDGESPLGRSLAERPRAPESRESTEIATVVERSPNATMRANRRTFWSIPRALLLTVLLSGGVAGGAMLAESTASDTESSTTSNPLRDHAAQHSAPARPQASTVPIDRTPLEEAAPVPAPSPTQASESSSHRRADDASSEGGDDVAQVNEPRDDGNGDALPPAPPDTPPTSPAGTSTTSSKPPSAGPRRAQPAHESKRCEKRRLDTQRAENKRDFETVIHLTKEKACWPKREQAARLFMEVNALLESKKFKKCMDTGGRSSDPKVKNAVRICRDILEQQK